MATQTGFQLASTPFEAEAIAALLDLNLVESNIGENILFQEDVVNVILALNGLDNCVEWQGRKAIYDSRTLLHKHCNWTFSHIPRDCSRAAHNLKNGLKLVTSLVTLIPKGSPLQLFVIGVSLLNPFVIWDQPWEGT